MHLPDWLKVKPSNLHNVKKILRDHRLSTVCEEARCPNMGYCFSKPTATFMILGEICTRNCGFCSVKSGRPNELDLDEPDRIADVVFKMGLKYVVITSVSRDDLPDGGATQFAKTIFAIRNKINDIKIEVLTPDFQGDINCLKIVLDAKPSVFNHNIETAKRLYYKVRPQSDYDRSLKVLKNSKRIAPGIKTKSGLMLGLGETFDEVMNILKDLREVGCDFVTIGQYLRPTKKNLPVVEYIRPEIFEELRERAIELGFEYVASGPFVRSSMNAEEMFNKNQQLTKN